MSTRRGRPACPICAAASIAEFRPFCSARCKDEDLRRWLVGAYRIPAAADTEPGGKEGAPEEDER